MAWQATQLFFGRLNTSWPRRMSPLGRALKSVSKRASCLPDSASVAEESDSVARVGVDRGVKRLGALLNGGPEVFEAALEAVDAQDRLQIRRLQRAHEL